MDRRHFIKNAAIASSVIAGVGFKGFGCTHPEKNIRWSMGWILWRDFGKANISITEAIETISILGLDGIEFTPRKGELSGFGYTREKFRDLLQEKKLSIAGNYFGGDFHDPEKHHEILSSFKETLENLKFYAAKNVVIGPPGRGYWSDQHHGSSSDSETDITDKIRAMAPFLNELGKIAQDSGIEIGLHPHVNTIVETPAEIDLIMELTDPDYVGMAPDTGHIQLGGGNPVEIIKKYSRRLCYFHLKDVAGIFVRPNFSPNIREMGKGEVNFHSVMKLLKEIEYQGWLNVEQDCTNMTPTESASESMLYINKIKNLC